MHAVAISGLTKRYGATTALDDVTVHINEGEVRAIIGENGAGKSTLVKILSGLVKPDAGDVSVFSRELAGGSPSASHALGIQTAFQEMTLVEHLTIAQNLLVPYEPTRFGMVRRAASVARAKAILDDLDLDIDPDALPGELDLATRQKVEIAKAMSRDPKLLLLDEPTSALTSSDVDWLHTVLERFVAKKVTVAFVSHRMEEVRRFCDSATLLRNGRHVGTYGIDEISDEEVVEHVIGRSVGSIFPAWTDTSDRKAPPLLAARQLAAGGKLKDASFSLRPGEVLGIAALQGMGQVELFRALFGDLPLDAGTLEVDGAAVSFRAPHDAIASGIDMGLVPEDRGTEGIALERPARETASSPAIGMLSHGGHLDRTTESAIVDEAFERLGVPPRADYLLGRNFSGGNQQKIVIAKWLVSGSRILLLMDPTRGIDIGAKHQIYGIIRDLAAEGRGILLYSTETSELVNLCDRVLVLYEGKIISELERTEASETAIVSAAMGTSQAQVSE